jgi:hypothetical protein
MAEAPLAAESARAAKTAAEHGFEKVTEATGLTAGPAKAAAEHAFKAWRRLEVLAVMIVGAELVVHLTFFGIAQHFIGFVDFLEFGFVSARFVGVVFGGQFAEGFFNLRFCGAAFHT